MPALSSSEVDAFLDEPGHLLRLATTDADGFPRLVPIWFVRRDEEVLFTPRGPSVFLANIRRDARVALSIDEDALPYRKVSVQGTARIVHDLGDDDEWRDLYRQIAKRYVDTTLDQPRALIGVAMGDASRTTTWRMPIEGEDPTGIWHRRYYVEGSRMAELADHDTEV